jgi:hypothetical protein
LGFDVVVVVFGELVVVVVFGELVVVVVFGEVVVVVSPGVVPRVVGVVVRAPGVSGGVWAKAAWTPAMLKDDTTGTAKALPTTIFFRKARRSSPTDSAARSRSSGIRAPPADTVHKGVAERYPTSRSASRIASRMTAGSDVASR